jgi:hypothetical protein
MPPRAKVRRRLHREEARQILEDLIAGRTEDIFVAYGRLFSLWNGNDAVLRELRPLFRIPGIDPCGSFAVTDEFRNQVISLASRILPFFSPSRP